MCLYTNVLGIFVFCLLILALTIPMIQMLKYTLPKSANIMILLLRRHKNLNKQYLSGTNRAQEIPSKRSMDMNGMSPSRLPPTVKCCYDVTKNNIDQIAQANTTCISVKTIVNIKRILRTSTFKTFSARNLACSVIGFTFAQ